MPTISQQLAALAVKRQTLVSQRDAYRNAISSRILSASQSSQYANQATRSRLASWASAIKSGTSLPTIAQIDQAKSPSTIGLNAEWAYFGTQDPTSVYNAAGGYKGGGIAALESLRKANKATYATFIGSDGGISALDAQIATLQAQLQAELSAGQAAGGTGQGGGTTVTPVTDDQIDQGSFAQTEAQSNERSRLRRDRARIAFGAPRFGVGINIPLGT